LGRIIHTTNPTRQRNTALKKMASAIRKFSASDQNDRQTTELAAELVISLQEIRDSVDHTAEAWEKRDYWLKADAFRRQWSWIDPYLSDLKNTLPPGNSADLRRRIADLGVKLNSEKIPSAVRRTRI
jgi:hypothetical protein